MLYLSCETWTGTTKGDERDGRKNVEMSIVAFIGWLNVVKPGETPDDVNTLAELYGSDSKNYLHGKFESLQKNPASWFGSLDHGRRRKLAEVVLRRAQTVSL